jgi:plastocyanin
MRHRFPILAGAILCGALALSACGSSTTSAAAPAKAKAKASSMTVIIHNFAFHPSHFTVRPGEQITITNEDPVDHTFTAFPGSSPQGHFNTGDIAPGATVSITAPMTPGAYQFYCQIHPYMTGVMTVS